MKVIQCPDSYDVDMIGRTFKIFLAGGISNCGVWQDEMIALLNHTDDKLVVMNPRRVDFDISNEKIAGEQIEWEFDHLASSDAVLFWFPPETLCPITLFELGSISAQNRPIFVGCHPDYARRFDVIKQLSLKRPGVKVRDTLTDVAKDAINWYSRSRYGMYS